MPLVISYKAENLLNSAQDKLHIYDIQQKNRVNFVELSIKDVNVAQIC